MAQAISSQHATFTPMQLQLLKMFSYAKTDEDMREIKSALSEYFYRRVEEGMDMLCEQGAWDEGKEEAILKEHVHTPYIY